MAQGAVSLLHNATIVTMNSNREVFRDGAVAIQETRILDVGVGPALRQSYPDAELVDCAAGVLIPGLINTHTHLFQTLLKGLGDDRTLEDWFRCMTGPSAIHLRPEDCYAAAAHGCAEALTTGTTTLFDFMYVHPCSGLADAVATAMDDTGIRGIVGRGYVTAGEASGMPPQLVESDQTALGDCQRLVLERNRPGARVTVALAPCMIWSVTEQTLRDSRQLADDLDALITMHVSESDYDVRYSLETFGARDTEVLFRCGLLGPDLLAVHTVQCTAADRALLAAHDVKISHNPCSNLYLASGIAPIPEMQELGLTVSLATDGPASSSNHSMLQALKFAALLHKGVTRNAEIVTAERALEMATLGGARAIGREQDLGSIEVGKTADLVLLEYDNLCITPVHHAVSALVYSARGDEVSKVWVDGRLVVDGGQLVTMDETAIRTAAQQAANALVERAGVAWLRTRAWR